VSFPVAFLCAVLWLLIALLVSPASMAAPCTGPEERVIGGHTTSSRTWPWEVSLLVSGDLDCGGALIGADVVLTAAHCITNRSDASDGLWQKIVVMAGDPAQGTARESRVKRVAVGPRFNGANESPGDVALLWLDAPLSAPGKALPRLVGPGEVKDLLTSRGCALVLGRGLTEPEPPGPKPAIKGVPELYIAEVPLQPRGPCSGEYPGLPPDQMCAGDGRKDSCQGDSGGPLFQAQGKEDRKDVVLIGIVSHGRGCAWDGMLGVYTNVGFHRDWILEQTGGKQVALHGQSHAASHP
jgi:secreted trypsin-like serine protease